MTSYTFLVSICSQCQGLTHSVHSPLSAGGKVELPSKFSKRGGDMAEPQLFLFRFTVNVKSLHMVCTPPSLSAWGVELPTKFSKGGGGGLVGPQLLERVAGKEWMTFFMGAMQFSHIKN